MIVTWTCPLCGWNNDNNDGPCRHCRGQTEERRVKGRWRTVIVKEPEIEMKGYYDPSVRKQP